MKPYCYLNGSILPVSDAKVSVYDIGLLRGYGIYEALTTYDGKPFMLRAHLERFRKSAEGLELKIPVTDEEITKIITELIAKNGYAETNVKFILTGGNTENSVEYNYETPTFYILAEEFIPLPENVFTEGCSLVTFEHERQLSQWKTIDYLQAVKLQKMRKEKGALEILYVVDSMVREAATSNFFIVQGGVLVTPKAGILAGITRRAVIESSSPHFKIEERDITLSEALSADEAFLTSSFKEVVPVVKIDDHIIGNGKVGPVTARVLALFRAFAKEGTH